MLTFLVRDKENCMKSKSARKIINSIDNFLRKPSARLLLKDALP